MKQLNLDRYKNEFADVSDNQLERIKTFIEENKFTKSDVKKFNERLERINDIKYNYLKIVLNIIPEATPRPRLNRIAGSFYVKNSSKNSKFMKLLVDDYKELFHFISTPCEFTVRNYFPIPKNFSKSEKLLAELGVISMITLPDWDNLGKTYSDMVQKWILCNDTLITKGTSEKYYSLKPRVEIIIKYKTDYETKKMKRLVEQSISYKNGVDCDEKV